VSHLDPGLGGFVRKVGMVWPRSGFELWLSGAARWIKKNEDKK